MTSYSRYNELAQQTRGRYNARGRAHSRGRGNFSGHTLDTDDDAMGRNIASQRGQRFTPYMRGGKGSKAHHPSRHGPGFDGGGDRQNWRVSIPHGKQHNQDWLIKSLKSACDQPFEPLNFRYEGMNAVFNVSNSASAHALRKTNRRVTSSSGFQVQVFVSASPASHTRYVASNAPITEDQKIVVKAILSRRYNPLEHSLDLSKFSSDSDFSLHKFSCSLNVTAWFEAVVQIINESKPEMLKLNLSGNRLTNLEQLNKLSDIMQGVVSLDLSNNRIRSVTEIERCLKRVKLTELQLEGNVLCDRFNDGRSYIEAVRKMFPKLIKLDNKELPPPILFGVEDVQPLPDIVDYCCPENSQTFVSNFIKDFLNIYDSGDRQGLLGAYHDKACFSFTVHGIASHENKGAYSDSRNLRKLTDTNTRQRYLKDTKLEVVAFLNKLPKTKHHLKNLKVDVPVIVGNLIKIILSGIFEEKVDDRNPVIRSFTRTFLALNIADKGIGIINDHLSIRPADPNSRFLVTPTPSSSPVPVQPDAQREMALLLSRETNMTEAYSIKCLEQTCWNIDSARQAFLLVREKLPSDAFN